MSLEIPVTVPTHYSVKMHEGLSLILAASYKVQCYNSHIFLPKFLYLYLSITIIDVITTIERELTDSYSATLLGDCELFRKAHLLMK